MVYADLHVHTTRSDGAMEPDEVPAAARRAGVTAVAITDHERLAPLEDPVVERDGVTLVSGIELRVEAGDRRVDLLGYGVRPTTDLKRELDGIQRNRVERGRVIVECVEAHLDVTLDVALDEGVGRPHVARAIDAHPNAPYGYQEAFDELIGSDGPCFVARDVPSFERGRDLLVEAGGVVALAHPLRYDDPASALALTAELDAVERDYPYERAVDLGPVDRAIAEHGLLETGGSDAHDHQLGRAGVSHEGFGQLLAAFR